MNGQFFDLPVGASPFGAAQHPAASVVSEARINWGRLLASLAISGVFHMALVLAPHLGMRSVASGGGARGMPEAAGARLLKATLMPEKRPVAVSPTGQSVKQAVEPMPAPTTPPATKAEQGSGAESALGAGALPLDAPVFHTADQLTQRPRPLAPPNLEAAAALRPPPLGTVILKLWIGDGGKVVSVEIEESQVPLAAATAAAEAFASVRFSPGEINGRAVGAIMRIEVTYDPPAPELPPVPPVQKN